MTVGAARRWQLPGGGEDARHLPDPLPIPLAGGAHGEVRPPPSKSVSHRCLNLALLLGGRSRVDNLLVADDTEIFLAALRACGAAVAEDRRGVSVEASADRLDPDRPIAIDCGNAGTVYRLLVATLSALPSGRFLVDGTPRLRERPIGPLVRALRQLGAELRYHQRDGYAPLEIVGGSLRGGECTIDAGESSQYLSALLMAGLRAREPVHVGVEALVSSPYVEVTLGVIADAGLPVPVATESGYRIEPLPGDRVGGLSLEVESDYSSAAYPAAAAVLLGGPVRVAGLRRDSRQGDRRLFEVLEGFGARVSWEPGVVVVRRGRRLEAQDLDLADMPDQVPTVAVIASFADGATSIRNVSHLRIKESDRLRAMSVELSKLSVAIEERDDGLTVRGSPRATRDGFGQSGRSVVLDTHDDHRIAMALAVAALRRGGAGIAAPRVVEKSYPRFWADLSRLIALAPP